MAASLKIDICELINFKAADKLMSAIELINKAIVGAERIAQMDSHELLNVKAATVMVFAILKELAKGKKFSEFKTEEWKSISKEIADNVVFADEKQYSVYIFSLYESYIRYSVDSIPYSISEKTADAIVALADRLEENSEKFRKNELDETAYIEDCLWICLEAMIKLVATTTALYGGKEADELSQALASFAFEYGRLKLYEKEQEILAEYISSQYELDEELEERYSALLAQVQKESEEFFVLIDNAFAPNFRDILLNSVLLAKTAGVSEEDILCSQEDVDDFFLN